MIEARRPSCKLDPATRPHRVRPCPTFVRRLDRDTCELAPVDVVDRVLVWDDRTRAIRGSSPAVGSTSRHSRPCSHGSGPPDRHRDPRTGDTSSLDLAWATTLRPLPWIGACSRCGGCSCEADAVGRQIDRSVHGGHPRRTRLVESADACVGGRRVKCFRMEHGPRAPEASPNTDSGAVGPGSARTNGPERSGCGDCAGETHGRRSPRKVLSSPSRR
jgi:hypothetical protein